MTSIVLGNETANIELYSKNVEACLKSVSNFNHTVYMNVCTGQSYTVPMGFWDYVVYIGLVFALFFLAGWLIKMITD